VQNTLHATVVHLARKSIRQGVQCVMPFTCVGKCPAGRRTHNNKRRMAPYSILVLLSRFMISTERKTRSCVVRTVICIGVINCLCFSVGEGLRLTPFPVSVLAEAEATDTQLCATALYEISLRKYGPLDVPTRVQRGKRPALDYGYPSFQTNRELAAHRVLIRDAGEPVRIVSVLSRSRSTGRAPPFIS